MAPMGYPQPVASQFYQGGQIPRGYYAPPNGGGGGPQYPGYPGQQPHGLPSPYSGGGQPYYGQPQQAHNAYPGYASPHQGHPQQAYPPYQQHQQQPQHLAHAPPPPPQGMAPSPYGHGGAHDSFRSILPTSVSSERGSAPAPLGVPQYQPVPHHVQQQQQSMARPPQGQMYTPSPQMGQAPLARQPSYHAQPPPPPSTGSHAPSLVDLLSPSAGAPTATSAPRLPNGPSPRAPSPLAPPSPAPGLAQTTHPAPPQPSASS